MEARVIECQSDTRSAAPWMPTDVGQVVRLVAARRAAFRHSSRRAISALAL
jgi:hypothetical protein